ncbi:hypothetical protein WICPIJ_009155 [Wickerhamomyces pijperi]|uniref:54S ribosomal protein L40, mitochondrial n=1 Tax=Wickerhamomyces pijperi TaxID=599730 RepID=A0A9P8TF44_WICPI|nr:hypothetical protein WICPIJ_009155 [Wickerhamomyces pijperi]
MSYLTKAGARFRLDIQNIPKHRLPYFKKLQDNTQPAFIRPQIDYDLHSEGTIPTDFSKLKYLVGDRVIITKGQKQGNICKVSRHVEHGGYVLDENGPTSTVVVPKEFWTEGQKSHVITFPKPVTEDQIRLVAEIEDSQTGQLKTVAVENLEFNGSYFDEDYKKVLPYRSVHGEPDLVIPYPRPEAKEDGPLSTEVGEVRERSFFVESIAKDLIPQEALLTIRNPKSKWRRGKLTRTEVKKLTPPAMPLTDVKKAYLAELQEKALKPTNVITEEMKAFLGEKIIKHEAVKLQQLNEIRQAKKNLNL